MVNAEFSVVIVPSHVRVWPHIEITFDGCCTPIDVHSMRAGRSNSVEIFELRQVWQFHNAHVWRNVQSDGAIETCDALRIIIIEDNHVVLDSYTDEVFRKVVEIAGTG